MPGWGSGPFGSGPFGRFDWSRQMLWLDLPEQPDRYRDSLDPIHPLEGFSESIQPLFEEIFAFATDFEHLRDPDDVRTQFQDVITGLNIVNMEVEETGRTSRVEFFNADPSDPLEPLQRASIGWVLTDLDGKEFTVNQVHKLSSAVIIKGNVLPVGGSATLRPPSLIRLLGADYGIIVDEHDPEQYQRSSVRNAWQWLSMKGTELGYDIVAKIAGYRAMALALYRITAGWAALLPPDGVYEIPEGSGIYYTDIHPNRALFDEVVADVIPVDTFCWEDRGDGITYGEHIGYSLQDLTVFWSFSIGSGLWRIIITGNPGVGDEIMGASPTMVFEDLGASFTPNHVGRDLELSGSTTPSNDGRFEITGFISPTRISYYNPIGVAELYGGAYNVLPNLSRFIASAGCVDGTHFAPWFACFPFGDGGRFYLEECPVDLGGGFWQIDVVAGDAPVIGATVSIAYECRIHTSCDYCRSSAIRLEVRPEEIATDPDARLENALERMVRKLFEAVPIHVRVVDVVHIVGPVDAEVHVDGSHIIAEVDDIKVIVPVSASIGYHFDIVEADIVEVDPRHITAEVAADIIEGTGDTIGGVAPNMSLTDAGGQFTSGMVGKTLTIVGATTGANNGPFTITSYTSPMVIGYSNAGGVAEAFLGTWQVDVSNP